MARSCGWCGQQGHNRTTCAKIPDAIKDVQKQQRTHSNIRCSFCNGYGHNISSCEIRKKVRKQMIELCSDRKKKFVEAVIRENIGPNTIILKIISSKLGVMMFVNNLQFRKPPIYRISSNDWTEDASGNIVLDADYYYSTFVIDAKGITSEIGSGWNQDTRSSHSHNLAPDTEFQIRGRWDVEEKRYVFERLTENQKEQIENGYLGDSYYTTKIWEESYLPDNFISQTNLQKFLEFNELELPSNIQNTKRSKKIP